MVAMRLQTLSLLAALTPVVLSDGVKFTSPASGGTVPAGSFQVEWSDGGGSPDLAQLTTFTLQVIFGGNDQPTDAVPLVTCGTPNTVQAATGTATCSIAAAVADNIKNGYYLQMQANIASGGTIVMFSDRFTISGMTGKQPVVYSSAAKAISGAGDVPEEQNNAIAAQNGAGATGAVGGTGDQVPYNLQTGLTKYAPMQPVPPTKITAKGYKPLFPTSGYTVATTWLGLPSIQTTITASQTFSVSSMENTGSPVSNPIQASGDMAKFLARWKD